MVDCASSQESSVFCMTPGWVMAKWKVIVFHWFIHFFFQRIVEKMTQVFLLFVNFVWLISEFYLWAAVVQPVVNCAIMQKLRVHDTVLMSWIWPCVLLLVTVAWCWESCTWGQRKLASKTSYTGLHCSLYTRLLRSVPWRWDVVQVHRNTTEHDPPTLDYVTDVFQRWLCLLTD